MTTISNGMTLTGIVKQGSKILMLILAVSSSVFAGSGVLKKDIITQRFSFEKSADVNNWQALAGQLSFSKKHFKDGKQSLLWQWQNQGELVLNNLSGLADAADFYPGGQPETYEPSYVEKSRQGGIKLWLYRETAHPTGQLIFNAAADQASLTTNPKYQFTMKQNFIGWRALWVHFEEDAKVANYQGSDVIKSLSIKASSDMKEDQVYIDLMQFLSFISKKRHSDNQFVNNKNLTRTDSYLINGPWQKLQQTKFADLPPITKDEKASLALIEQRMAQLILGDDVKGINKLTQGKEFSEILKKKISGALKTFKKLDIQKQGGVVTGIPIFSGRDEQPAEKRVSFQQLSSEVFFPLALDYKLSQGGNDKGSKKQEKLARLFDLFDYFEDQGWAAGSSVGTTDHIIRLSGFATAVFLLRDELAATNRLTEKQGALAWHTRFGRLVELDTLKGENTDHVRGGALAKLISVLVMPDSAGKVARMKSFQAYLTHASNFAPGYSDTIKPDFSIYHHRSAYMGSYGIQSVTTLAILHWLMADTEFALPQENQQRLNDTLLAQVDFAAGVEIHPGAAGRFPYKNSGLDRFLLPAFAFLIDAKGKQSATDLTNAFARIYRSSDHNDLYRNLFPALTYYGSYGTLELMNAVYQKHSTLDMPARTGNFQFPYAAVSTHKNKDWVASVRGFSKYVWDFESGSQQENPFGRYMSFGALMLFSQGSPLSLEASGVDLDGGFHWGFLPGATTKAMPMAELAYKIKPDKKYVEGKHRNYTENTFVGGLSFNQDNGIFAMDFRDTVTPDDDKTLFDDSFGFKKSFFFIDDEIIALGSNIANDDDRFNTVTTLYQSKLISGQPSSASVNGAAIDDSLTINQQHQGGMFSDPQGNYYIVPQDYTVKLIQDKQVALVPSRNKKQDKKQGGKLYIEHSSDHIKAYIDHGKNPKQQSYEYLILPQAKPSKAAKKLAEKGYQVIQQNDNAHIIHHQSSDIVAYALFNGGATAYGPLQSTNTPIMAMVKVSQNKLSLSVVDPDLRLKKWNHNMSFMPEDIVQGKAGEHVATLSLSGLWAIDELSKDIKSIVHKNGNTLLKIRLDNGLTREFNFYKSSLKKISTLVRAD